jgi:hypothetical protein
MTRLLVWKTRIGPFYIVHSAGRYYPVYKDEFLGAYTHPQHAIDDLAGGHTYSLNNGVDTSTLGISYDLAEWERC